MLTDTLISLLYEQLGEIDRLAKFEFQVEFFINIMSASN